MNNTETKRNDNTESITFKLSVQDKQKIQDLALDINLSLSEYIRIKLLIDEEYLNKIIQENTELKKLAKESAVRGSFLNPPIQNDTLIKLKSSNKGIDVMRMILSKMGGDIGFLFQPNYDLPENVEAAISILIAEKFSDYVEDIPGLREIYGINSFEDFYKLLFESYFEKVFGKEAGTKHLLIEPTTRPSPLNLH